MEISIYKGHHVPEAKGVCVVIDVIRAFTTAAFAFGNGVKEIVFVSSIDEAFYMQQLDSSLILMGERDGIKIDQFHFGNSPREIEQASLQNRRMVQRTSSGTQGIVGCSHAPHIFAASFVTAEATLRSIMDLNPDHVSFIATGRNNGDEDLAFADYLKARLEHKPSNLEALFQRVRCSPAALRMIQGDIAYPDGQEDIEMALKINYFPFAIKVYKEGGRLIGRTISHSF